MHKYLFVILIGLGLQACKSFIPRSIIPYSMIKVEEGVYIDQTEITVEQWAEFVYDDNEQYKPDSNISKQYKYHQVFYPSKTPDSLFRAFGKIDYYSLPVPKAYFDTLNYNQLREILDYPITGITYQNAVDYCQWRTEKYNQQNTSHSKKSIRFSIPTSSIYEVTDTVENASIANVYLSVKDDNNIYGLQSNVSEFYQDMADSTNLSLGFRCMGEIH